MPEVLAGLQEQAHPKHASAYGVRSRAEISMPALRHEEQTRAQHLYAH